MRREASEREATEDTPLSKVPRHLAIIMDGNGRWARARGLPRTAGHREGVTNLRRVVPMVLEFGIPILTIYAFSTENWARPAPEVRALMRLFEQFFDNEINELKENGVRVRHIGRTRGLAARFVEKIQRAQELTQDNSRLLLNVAFNYGGRAEIVDAVRQIVSEGIPAAEIDEDTIAARLTTSGLPDPDLVIRTGGDMRLSNFLIWQSSYAEYYSTPTLWPDLDRDELYSALLAYQQRERRFGRLSEQSR